MKVFKWLAIVVAGLIVVVLGTLRLTPGIYVSIANTFLQSSGQSVQTENLQIRFFPLQILSKRLELLEGEVPAFSATNLDGGVKIWDALVKGEPYWWLLAGSVVIAPAEAQPEEGGSNREPVNFESLLTFSELKIDRLSFAETEMDLHLVRAGENIAIDVHHPLGTLTGVLSTTDQGYRLVVRVPSVDVAQLVAQQDSASPSTETALDFSLLDQWRLNARLQNAANHLLGFNLDAQGVVRVPVLESFHIQLELELQDVKNANTLGFDFYSITPLQVGAYIEAEGSRLNLTEIDIKYLESDVAGALQMDLGADLTVAGAIQSTRLQLPQATEDGVTETLSQEPPAEEPPLFADEAIDWSWLDTADVGVSLQATRFDIGDAPFENLQANVRVADGKLVLSPLQSQFGEGGFEGALELTHVDNGVELKTNFNLHDVDLESFGFVPAEELIGGATDIVLTLESSGVTAADLAAGLRGDILLMVQGATVQNDTFELFGSDVFMETLHKLNPFSESDPTTELECALVHFEVNDGVLKSNNQLVVETTKMEIVGDGSIDLKDESIDIGISPSSREGVGVNVGSLVKFMKLGGTLRKPTPQADALGVLQSGAAIGAAVSTGGVSVLAEGLIKRISNAGSACKRILEKQEESVEITEAVETPG